MSEISSLYDNSPDSLQIICLENIISNLDMYTEKDTSKYCWRLKDDIILPAEICENFLQVYQKTNRVNDHFASLFRNRLRTRLDTVKLRNSRVTIDGISWLLKHKPSKIELLQCEFLSQNWLDLINSNSENLVSLKLGPLSLAVGPNEIQFLREYYFIDAPKLRRLTIQCGDTGVCPVLIPKPLCHLTHLNLSDYSSPETAWALYELKNLVSLVLHSVVWSVNVVEWIEGLSLLQHLDISQLDKSNGIYVNPNEVLARLITKLPHLESLDISGTNLAGTGSVVPAHDHPGSSRQNDEHVGCDIPGLVSRMNRPLKFLGLYGTHHSACRRHHIPAEVITGDANEKQIVAAGISYRERPLMLTHILNDMYYKFRDTEKYNDYVGLALSVVLDAMEKYVFVRHIQLSGSATLFYIVKGKEKSRLTIKLKKRIITALLDGMEAHIVDDSLMRNGCLTLCQFKIPTDVLFEFERVVQILLNGVVELNQERFVQRIAIYLLNSLACQVDGRRKRFLGNHGAIGKMLNLISDRLERGICDDILEVAWSTMWNVTDETPQNCQRFLDNRGMEYFIDCLQRFPDKAELLRNMMGLLGNVAEVAYLRPKLMNELFLEIFYELLNSSSDGIEVSYNAAGVLAHMLSDGSEAWTANEPTREAVLERIATAVERWDRGAERNINYRSFEPILTLLETYHTPQCQHWAVWALANLTTVYPDKYCSLVACEGGIRLLRKLLLHPKPYFMIKELALVVINNCSKHLDADMLPPPVSPEY